MTLAVQVSTPLRDFPLEVELSVPPGQTLALVGPSGAGKTTLLRIVAGLTTPHSGRVGLGDEDWLDTTRSIEVPVERRRCGLVFQDYALFPHMSAWRNVAYGIDLPRAERRAEAIAMLERFGVADLAEVPAASLSGGERQRVAVARALAAQPRALLLDEPLAALDTTTRGAALRELRGVLAKLSVPALLVTHSFEDAALLADRLAIIDRGAVIQSGSPGEISAQPRSAFVADFTGAVVLRGEAEVEAGGLTRVRLTGGGELHSVDHAEGPVAVSVFPWEISLEAPAEPQREPLRDSAHREAHRAPHRDSMLNRVEGEISSLTTVGNRTRVAISLPQPLSAEVTERSVQAMGLRIGDRITAAWKASATRLIPLS